MTIVIVSGLAQGDDPAGGVGVAHCLRRAFSPISVIGVDYSVRAAGLHADVFDDVVIHRPWGEFDTDSLRADIADRLADGAFVIPTIDLEAYWLATHFPEHPAILSPPAEVFWEIAKPWGAAPDLGGLRRPDAVLLSDGPDAVHGFLRRNGMDAWFKGPFHDALRVRSWEALPGARRQLEKYWPFDGVHLQQHVRGTAEAIAFAAWRGEILDAIWIAKNDTTAAGKTIAGTMRPVSPADWAALEAFAARHRWTGGGEIEVIRDADDGLWLVEVNARFPGWIAGAALLGHNLPARLLAAATGRQMREMPAADGFARVQQEVPVRAGYPLLPPLVLNPDEPLDAAKTAFSIHEIAVHLKGTVGLPTATRRSSGLAGAPRGRPLPPLPVAEPVMPTPRWHFSARQVEARITSALEAARSGTYSRSSVALVYSLKTNPDPSVLEICARLGVGVDVISEEELAAATGAGIPLRDIVFNGPFKRPAACDRVLDAGGAVYADSLEELASTMPRLKDRTCEVGLRIRPPGMGSRFGIPVEHPWAVAELIDLLRSLDAGRAIGLQVHMAHGLIGRDAWRAMVEELAQLAVDLEDEGSGVVTTLDLGGGFYPADFPDELDWVVDTFRPRCEQMLPHLRRIVLEPGRALVQDAGMIQCTVLEVRRAARSPEGWARDVIADASIAELPEAAHFPHRVCALAIAAGRAEWARVPAQGCDRLLGRTCMEADILAQRLDFTGIKAGDQLLILDAGSYDRSMTYEFGRGRYCAA